MRAVNSRIDLLLLPFALCGFALAQPVYQLLLQTPQFLVVRQNTMQDVWVLALVLSFILPLTVALPAWLAWRRWPAFSSWWCWSASSLFAALFAAQFWQQALVGHWWLFIGLVSVPAVAIVWLLLFSRWSLLATVLAGLALIFPVWFLLFSPVEAQLDDFAGLPVPHHDAQKPLPDIVLVVLDELPLATLLDLNGDVDKKLFPGFARLQALSTWYYNTTTVSDGTVDAVPAILTGRYPHLQAPDLTVAVQPVNLFTLLRRHYHFNVAEAVTRLCPEALCPRAGPHALTRIRALLLDLTAIYLHRVLPAHWLGVLPEVADNWSGFFAERQVFFPQGWVKFAGQQTAIDRPAFFRQFTHSIQKLDTPTLNFMHVLLPHGPQIYLPDGENYGWEWMRGQQNDRWENVEWGPISGKQRHYLQVQYVDHLLGNLLDRIQQQGMLKDSMIVVVADHGISFAINDQRRSLSASNAAAMLRVPLFIKFPGQSRPQRIETPAMTIDILPTVLAAAGFSSATSGLQGTDLQSLAESIQRTRRSNSHLQRSLREVDETRLDITRLVAKSRQQLKLDEPLGRLWQIGPYDAYRGQPLKVVCDKLPAQIKVHFNAFRAAPDTRLEDTVHAYVAGNMSGADVPVDSMPFLISSHGLIVASGYTWRFRNRAQFFALVEPKYVRQPGWSPRAWLLAGHRCLEKRNKKGSRKSP